MVFQVIAPKQIQPIVIGRQNVQFVYQAVGAFEAVNREPWLDALKTEAGFAKIAGVELTLFDCAVTSTRLPVSTGWPRSFATSAPKLLAASSRMRPRSMRILRCAVLDTSSIISPTPVRSFRKPLKPNR